MTDPISLEGVRRAGRSLAAAFEDGTNLAAREDMALAALFSGIALTNAGLGAVHGFAAPLGASFPIPHGTICAALLPGVMAANIAEASRQNHPVVQRYATIGRVLLNRPGLSDGEAISGGLAFVEDLVRRLRIPQLGTFGMGQADVAPIVALARKSSSMRYNPLVLSDELLNHVLAGAL